MYGNTVILKRKELSWTNRIRTARSIKFIALKFTWVENDMICNAPLNDFYFNAFPPVNTFLDHSQIKTNAKPFSSTLNYAFARMSKFWFPTTIEPQILLINNIPNDYEAFMNASMNTLFLGLSHSSPWDWEEEIDRKCEGQAWTSILQNSHGTSAIRSIDQIFMYTDCTMYEHGLKISTVSMSSLRHCILSFNNIKGQRLQSHRSHR
jgi:hypothetical protein